jgi:hypothetical protein
VNVDPQEYLDLVEKASSIVFLDIESTGLKGDYNSVICVSLKPFGKKPYTLAIKRAGNDQKVVNDTKRELEKFSCWVTYYGKGFDLPMLNTRLLKWGSNPIEKKFHLDMYYSLKTNTLVGHRSQAHLLAWLGTPEQKMTVSADVWSGLSANPTKYLPILIQRCESDVRGLEALYKRTRHLIREIKR